VLCILNKENHIFISDLAVKELKKLKYQYDIVFVKYKYNYLFGKISPLMKNI
jgi:hypothetical protein